jgi:hypothetical protein
MNERRACSQVLAVTWAGGGLTARQLDGGGGAASREWGPFLCGPLAQGTVAVDGHGGLRLLALVTDASAGDNGETPTESVQLLRVPLSATGAAERVPVTGANSGTLWNVQFDGSGNRLVSVRAYAQLICCTIE